MLVVTKDAVLGTRQHVVSYIRDKKFGLEQRRLFVRNNYGCGIGEGFKALHATSSAYRTYKEQEGSQTRPALESIQRNIEDR